MRRSQWPSALKTGSAADRLLYLLVRTPLGYLSLVIVVCCQVECDGPITHPEDFYRLRVFNSVSLGNPQMEEVQAHEDCEAMKKYILVYSS